MKNSFGKIILAFVCDITNNNLIPYQKLSTSHPDYKKVAIGIRIIDINTGDILQVGELTNIN